MGTKNDGFAGFTERQPIKVIGGPAGGTAAIVLCLGVARAHLLRLSWLPPFGVTKQPLL